ncbi:PAS domain S-box-containing protein [Azospirillum agricola]|uniref:hybrid sensor histidine kinase/response regulator n=1 Tax=Azospirillum agricola TaxID=1720247 RepID=UPI001AE1A2EA|nr:response regulator [Azospirillum agricola]MBP2228769.1 PAS domain S-box-containing protein [Azospirillum agricola]
MPYSQETAVAAPDTLSKRLIRAAAVTAILLTAMVLLAAQWAGTGIRDRLAGEQAQALAREVRERVADARSRTLEGARLIGLAVAAHNESPDVQRAALDELGRRAIARAPELSQFWIVPRLADAGEPSTHGGPVAAPDATVFSRRNGRIEQGEPLDDTDRALIERAAESGRAQVHGLRPDPGSAAGVSTHVEPLMIDQEVVGVIGYDIDALDWLRIGESVEHAVPGSRLAILTVDGHYVFADDRTRIGQEPTVDEDGRLGDLTAEEARALHAGAPFSGIRNLPGGGTVHRVGLPLPRLDSDYPQYILLDVPLPGFDTGMLLFGLTTLAILGVFLLVLRTLVHRMAGVPLEHLRTAVRMLDSGNHHIPLPAHMLERGDQIGDIARALDDLRRSEAERRELREMVIRNARDVERMIAAIDSTPDMIVLLDAAQRILYLNQAACDLVGARDADAVLGQHMESLEDPDTTRRRTELGVFDALEREGSWEGVIENYRTPFGVRIAAMDLRFTRRLNGDVVIIGRDVSARLTAASERVDLERRLSQMDKMDAVGRLAGGIAHDFNNLLGAVSGYADFLFCDLPAGTPQRDYAGRIRRVCDRAKDMVHQILAFSRAGNAALAPTLPGRILEDAAILLRSAIPSSVTLEIAVPDELPRMRANGTQLVQVLVNLAINARDALPDETGRIDVAARLWNGDTDPAGDGAEAGWTVQKVLPPRLGQPHVLFEVSDSGAGMDEAVMAKAFDPFYTTKDLGEGTGLGLAVVFGIVQAHGGGLVVCSQPGAGSVMRVFIPLCADTAPAEEADEFADVARLHARRRCRVLVVDDEGDMGDMVSVGLERIGHEVAVCEDPRDAIEAFEEDPDAFDLVITDQTMPGISGITLIRRLKDRRPDLPCILYTGYSRMVDQASAIEAGADAFFLKPVKISTLAEAIDRLQVDRPGRAPALETDARDAD